MSQRSKTIIWLRRLSGTPRRWQFWLAAATLSVLTTLFLAAAALFLSSLILWLPPVAASQDALLPVVAEWPANWPASDRADLQTKRAARQERPRSMPAVRPAWLMKHPIVSPSASSTRHQVQPTAPPALSAAPAALPTPAPLGQLIIPSLDVWEPVVPVRVRDGQWDISGLGMQIGLLETTGRQPGDDLAMAFTGHVTVPWPGVGPFADLIRLQRGQMVIYRWGGVDYVYEVERIFLVRPEAVDLLYVPDGDKIILVTCTGWDFLNRSYEQRLVMRATLVQQAPAAVEIESGVME